MALSSRLPCFRALLLARDGGALVLPVDDAEVTFEAHGEEEVLLLQREHGLSKRSRGKGDAIYQIDAEAAARAARLGESEEATEESREQPQGQLQHKVVEESVCESQ